MGIIISRFRNKKSSEELLEDIQKNIEKLENDSKFILKREKAIVFRWIFFSVLIYILAALLFYFCFFPASLWDRLFYIIPLLIFPIIIIVVRRLIKWLYDRDIKNSSSKLNDLKSKKKEILDDVMNTETYKKAKEILDKYAPEHLKKPPPPTPPILTTLNQPLKTPVKKLEGNQPTSAVGSSLQLRQNSTTPMHRSSPIQAAKIIPIPRRLPRPLLPQDRSFLDRMIESIVGDGLNNRYALICKACSSHNGMALKEEFEYLSFRCAYCGSPNPSLKVRPREMPPGFTPLQQAKPTQNMIEYRERRFSNAESERRFSNAGSERRFSNAGLPGEVESSSDACESSKEEDSEKEQSPEKEVDKAKGDDLDVKKYLEETNTSEETKKSQ